jgi:predicted phosphodiesterase
MRVLIIGDIHGAHRELAEILRDIQSRYGIRAAIQVGDFGFYKEPMARLRRDKIRFPVPLHVIDGNHEDHAWLRRALLTGAARHWEAEANLFYQPRPSVVELGGSWIGFLGGALHVDRPQQHNLLSRFPNYLLRHQRQQAAALFNRKRPALLVTHSCPADIGIGMEGAAALSSGVVEHIVSAGFDPGPAGDCGEAELKQLWLDLKYRPCGWVFGHFHRPHEALVQGTRFICVGGDLASLDRHFILWDADEQKLLTVRGSP